MKVCMFTIDECDETYDTGRRVAKSLADAGHDVRIIARMGKDTPRREERYGYRVVRVRLRTYSMSSLRLWTNVRERFVKPKQVAPGAGPSGPVGGSAKDSGSPSGLPVTSRIASLPRHSFKSVFKGTFSLLFKAAVYMSYCEYYWRTFWEARREPGDVYHAHNLITLPVAWACSHLTHAKLIYDSHELWLELGRVPPRSRFNRFLVRSVESFLIRGADATIAPGVSVAEELRSRYSIPEPIVILNVPLYRPFEPSTILRDEMQIPPSERILLYVGGFDTGRGLETGIRSIRHLPHCRLILLGRGPDDYVSSLKEIIRTEGLTDRVHFRAAVPYDQVTRYAMSADVGLVLYQYRDLNSYYSSPNKLFQCMAAGLPVVGSNFPDLRMYIEGYNFGATCDPESPREVANAVDYILAEPHRYEQMRQNALEAARIFNWENDSKKLVALYDGLRPKPGVSKT